VHLAILDKDEALYIEKTEPPGFIRLNTWVGKRNKLHCSAVGKALLGYLSEAESRKLCPPSSLTRRTNRTITSLTVLLADLAKVRLRGYAIDDGEDEAEGRCVAAPVFCADGKVVASVSVSGTMTQIDVHKLDALGKLVRNYAAQISGRLGYTASERKKGASGP
jgi:DNA-binding IclR family transcriptional regulator